MKVVSVTEITELFIEIEGAHWTDHRRSGPNSWEVRMGMSWEEVVWPEDCAKLEAAYQEWLNKQ